MPESHTSQPRATVVIEWENIQLAEQARCLEMLRNLSRQIDEVCLAAPGAGGIEVLLLFDDEKCSAEDVRRVVEPYFPPAKPHCTLRLTAAPGLNYYEQKNRGAREAAAEIVVYLDSDVIPEDNWLTSLLTPFADANVEVVCGNSYLTATGPYSKAFALFWFFPLRARNAVFEPRTVFFANNVAFRREVIRRASVRARGRHDARLVSGVGASTAQDGIVIYHNSAAQVSHPAPFGLSHFVNRALAQGRDRHLMRKSLNKGSFVRTFPKVALLPLRAVWRILRHRRQVSLSLVELPAALAVAVTYNLLAISGYLLTRLAPNYAQRHWHI